MRSLRLVTQHRANLSNAVVQTLFKIDKGLIAPEFLAQLFPRDNLSCPPNQHRQNLEGLRLNPYNCARPAQLLRLRVQFEGTKPQNLAGKRGRTHENQPQGPLACADYTTADLKPILISRCK